jgi:cell division protein FtsL
VTRTPGRATGNAAPALRPEPQPQPGRPEGESTRHLQVVGARPRVAWSGRRRARILCFVASIAAIVVAFGLVYLHVLSAQKQFQIDHLTTVETQAQTNYEQLRLSVEAANSPARVMAAALALGMHEPPSVTVVKGVGSVGSPAAPVVRKGSEAPGGAADYANNKSNLTSTP